MQVLDWTPVDVCNWLKRSVEVPVNNALVYANDVDGCQLLTLPEGQIETILEIGKFNSFYICSLTMLEIMLVLLEGCM